MELTATGSVWNEIQLNQQPFTLHFALTGGTAVTAGCDSWQMGATISDFSAVIGGQAFAAPSSFLANLTTSPYPTCSGPQQIEITNATGPQDASNWLTLNYAQTSDPSQHFTFTGNIGGWYVASSNYTISNGPTAAPEIGIPEPSTLALFAGALAILLAHRRSGWRFRRR